MVSQNQNDVQQQNHMYLSCGDIYFFGAVILERGLRFLTKFMGCFCGCTDSTRAIRIKETVWARVRACTHNDRADQTSRALRPRGRLSPSRLLLCRVLHSNGTDLALLSPGNKWQWCMCPWTKTAHRCCRSRCTFDLRLLSIYTYSL
jgi:hypothetical protein